MTYRPQQLYLSEIILDQLMHSDKAMIEAPLGSGKSLHIYLQHSCTILRLGDT